MQVMMWLQLGKNFLLVDLPDFFLQILGQGDKKKKSSENDQSTGHFQSFFFYILRTNSKTSKENQLSVLNFKYVIIFLKNLQIGQSLLTVSLSKLQKEPKKKIQRNKYYLESADKIKK